MSKRAPRLTKREAKALQQEERARTRRASQGVGTPGVPLTPQAAERMEQYQQYLEARQAAPFCIELHGECTDDDVCVRPKLVDVIEYIGGVGRGLDELRGFTRGIASACRDAPGAPPPVAELRALLDEVEGVAKRCSDELRAVYVRCGRFAASVPHMHLVDGGVIEVDEDDDVIARSTRTTT